MSKQKYVQATDLEHMRNQTSMYLGSKSVMTSEEYVYNGKHIMLEEVRIVPAAIKTFDEILVNCVDQYTKYGSDIWVNFDDSSITMTNNKSSIHVYETETRDGRKMFTPQLIFGEFKTSSNFDTSQVSITGGKFGTGAKGVNAFSKFFSVETYDPNSDKLFYIEWKNCMHSVTVPEIVDNPPEKIPFVRITFELNFVDFGMTNAHMDHFKKLCYMRVMHTAAFCNSKVFWNDVQVTPRTSDDLARLYLAPWYEKPQDIRALTFTMTNSLSHRWTVTLGVKENTQSLEQISIINGIYVKKGSHITHLVNQILTYIKPLWQELKDPSKKISKVAKNKSTTLAADKEKAKAEKNKTLLKEIAAMEKELKAKEAARPKFDKRYIEKYLFIMLVGYINQPSFTGQRKDEIDSPEETYQGYTIPTERLKEFWEMIQPWIEFDIFTKASEKGTSTRKKIVKAKKYSPAKNSGTSKRATCSLFIAEGDSAFGTIDKGISSKHSKLSYDDYGIFSVQGVPMNARKEITRKIHPKTGEVTIVRNERLKENERLNSLVDILNLSYTKSYASDDECRTINYGHVILAADQDEDGKGNIRSQIFNFFWTFWPELVKKGFIQFLITPIVRAFHKRGKQTVKEFFTEEAYHKWSDTIDNESEWEVVYYKGLGSHGQQEIDNMFSKFNTLLITYTTDVKTETACEVYFGNDPDLRKLVLKKPPTKSEEDYYVYLTNCIQVSATHHLNTATKNYQIYNISRHIKHEIDGGLPSRRKVWAGARKLLTHNNSRLKVFQLGGDVAKSMNYHHGDASLTANITGETQDFPGAREFPMLLALSNSGSRKKGGSDAGSPRYIYTKLNKHLSDALFPHQDDYILEYTFDDGCRGEPVFYVPTVPLAILENYTSPGHGWTCVTWARDYWEVSQWIRECVTKGWKERPIDFSFTKHRVKHELEDYKGVENSVGTFTVSGNILTITELPVRMWNENFLFGNGTKDSKGVADMDYIVDTPVDKSTDTDIHIELKFQDGFLAGKSKEDIIKLLGLKQSLKPNLNFIGINKAVNEYTKYTEVFDVWYKVREQYYIKRVVRMIIILKLKSLMLAEQLKYANIRETLDISGKRTAIQNEILEKNGFLKINKTLLTHPSYIPADELENAVLRSPSSTWDYIRKMDADDLSDEGISSLEDKKAAVDLELAELQEPNAAKKIQLKELDKLDDVVKQGQTKGWLSWEPKATWQRLDCV